jgi:uncharacterized membrane protein (UPF0127 family)
VQTHIQIGNATVAVEKADTESLREQGLSGRASLPEGQGMLFVFDSDGLWGIWMKDMQFSLDILWVDANGTVITVAANVSPSTYTKTPPEIFYPAAPARYVVELPAGFAAARGIKAGSVVKLWAGESPAVAGLSHSARASVSRILS